MDPAPDALPSRQPRPRSPRGLALVWAAVALMLGSMLLAIGSGHHDLVETADRFVVTPAPLGLVGLGGFGAGLASLALLIALRRDLWRDPDDPARRAFWRSPPALALLGLGCIIVLAALAVARSEMVLDAGGLRHVPALGTQFEARWPEIRLARLLQYRTSRWSRGRGEVDRKLALGTAAGAHIAPLGGYTLEEVERLIAWIERHGVPVQREPVVE